MKGVKPPIVVPTGDYLSYNGKAALLLVFATAWIVRGMAPHYSTAWMDEAAYIIIGRMWWSGHFEGSFVHPMQWIFGWYLWPIMAAAADQVGGLVGVREMAALLGGLTTLAVYGFARRLFSPAVGVVAAAVFAVLGPAVFVFRIATRDAGSLFFLVVGLWLYVRAWQEDKRGLWIASWVALFASFLCKYLMALYFPALVLLALQRRWRSVWYFGLPFTLFSAVYGLYFWQDHVELLRFARGFESYRAEASEALRLYILQRIDSWVMLGLAIVGLVLAKKAERWTCSLLLFGAALMPAFQFFSRADRDWWKHVNYTLIFLLPVAAFALLRLLPKNLPVRVVAVVVLGGTISALGNTWRIERVIFWPNVTSVVEFMDGLVQQADRILVDDTALRYYFEPPLHQTNIADPYSFWYKGMGGYEAHRQAVADGYFDFLILVSNFHEAQEMQKTIRLVMSDRYVRRFSTQDAMLNWPVEVWERRDRKPGTGPGPRVEILSPAAGALVRAADNRVPLEGRVEAAPDGSYVLLDIHTNRWYIQGEKIWPRTDGPFSQEIVLGGQGDDQCRHLVRARLLDSRNRVIAVTYNADVARANPDGSPPPCRNEGASAIQ